MEDVFWIHVGHVWVKYTTRDRGPMNNMGSTLVGKLKGNRGAIVGNTYGKRKPLHMKQKTPLAQVCMHDMRAISSKLFKGCVREENDPRVEYPQRCHCDCQTAAY